MLAAAVLLTVLSACDDPEPTTYRIPKEDRSSESPDPMTTAGENGPADTSGSGMQAMPGMRETSEKAGQVDYETPDGWESYPASGIRKANFKVAEGKADVAITVFPGDVGGDLANVNRWRRQIDLSPIPEDELSQFTEPVEIAGETGSLVRLEGSSESILAGMVRHSGNTWFFKMQGSNATVLEQEDAMREFLDSVTLQASDQ
ncbi:MAG: hypothetical protein ACLFO5_04810 [Opitutales bacterium]